MKESKSSATIRRRRQQTTRGDVASRSHFRSLSSSSSSGATNEDEIENEDSAEMFEGPRVLRAILSSEWTLFCGLLAFRSLNALVVQSSYVPDEYWQSIEVAHRMSFGYGFLTWEWRHGLRSYIYPLLFAVPYKMLHFLHLDYRLILIKLPRLMQACLAALGDLYVYKLTRRLSGSSSAHWTLLCQLTSWFNFYCSTRTLTNSSEAVFTAIALYYYPWPQTPRLSQWKFIIAAGLSVIVRPTAAITWLPLGVWLLYRQQQAAWKLIKYTAELGLLLLLVTSAIDRQFYGHWVSVQYNFVQFNVLSDLGRIYGSHPVHWYLTQGLPVVLATHLPIMLVGLWYNVAPVFLAVIGWSVAVYSGLSHKEFRFMLGVMPLIMHVCGRTLHLLVKSSRPIKSLNTTTLHPISSPDTTNSHPLSSLDKTKSDSLSDDAISKQNLASNDSDGPIEQHIEKNVDRKYIAAVDSFDSTSLFNDKNADKYNSTNQNSSNKSASVTDNKFTESADNVATESVICNSNEFSSLKRLSGEFSKLTTASVGDRENVERKDSRVNVSRVILIKRLLVVSLLVINIPISLYTCLIHQRGTVDVISFLYQESYRSALKGPQSMPSGFPGTPVESHTSARFFDAPGHGTGAHAVPEEMSVLFLMPCHSTPYYSYLHRNITMRFLTCEPNLHQSADHVDVADEFFLDPASWLTTNLFNQSHINVSGSSTNQWPSRNSGLNNSTSQNQQDIKQGSISINQGGVHNSHSNIPINGESRSYDIKDKTAPLHNSRTDKNQSKIFSSSSLTNDETDNIEVKTDDWLNAWDDSLHYCGNVARTPGLPTHIVMFDELSAKIGGLLRDFNYRQCFRAFHTHFPEGRVSSQVIVMCR